VKCLHRLTLFTTVPDRLSDRLRRVVDALPLEPGLRVLEIGGAPGAAAREVAARVGPTGHVLVLDRSSVGIARTEANCADEVSAGLLSTLKADAEDFALPAGVALFDLAFACRVGALDGRHPRLYESALACIARALTPTGRLFVDTGNPMRELSLPR
jgi:ubiquinone/menaquinone biosynthesis C-methylase UbiE